MLLLILEMFLPDRPRRRSNRASTTSQTTVANPFAETAALLLLLALPLAAHASPASALREYNAGDYQNALKDYNKLLEQKKDDPRLHFNAGAAAYQSHQLDQAVKEFNQALNSPDLQLQQRAYYNLANSMYRLGQQLPDADKKKEAWENAVKGYESALKLNPQDADAKFNQEFVKKQLEELQKQQQSQDQKNNNVPPSEEAKKAKAAADLAVQNRAYRKALEIMEAQLQKDSTTSYYQDYIQRLKEVNGVQTNSAH